MMGYRSMVIDQILQQIEIQQHHRSSQTSVVGPFKEEVQGFTT